MGPRVHFIPVDGTFPTTLESPSPIHHEGPGCPGIREGLPTVSRAWRGTPDPCFQAKIGLSVGRRRGLSKHPGRQNRPLSGPQGCYRTTTCWVCNKGTHTILSFCVEISKFVPGSLLQRRPPLKAPRGDWWTPCQKRWMARGCAMVARKRGVVDG